MKAADRTCCDGLCEAGQSCPAVLAKRQGLGPCLAPRLAPGVLDGPYRRDSSWREVLHHLVTVAGRKPG